MFKQSNELFYTLNKLFYAFLKTVLTIYQLQTLFFFSVRLLTVILCCGYVSKGRGACRLVIESSCVTLVTSLKWAFWLKMVTAPSRDAAGTSHSFRLCYNRLYWWVNIWNILIYIHVGKKFTPTTRNTVIWLGGRLQKSYIEIRISPTLFKPNVKEFIAPAISICYKHSLINIVNHRIIQETMFLTCWLVPAASCKGAMTIFHQNAHFKLVTNVTQKLSIISLHPPLPLHTCPQHKTRVKNRKMIKSDVK